MARRAWEVRRFRDEVLDELLAGANPAEVFADGGLLDDLKKAVAERALDAEMDAHLERLVQQGLLDVAALVEPMRLRRHDGRCGGVREVRSE